jgi:hypothetical protein
LLSAIEVKNKKLVFNLKKGRSSSWIQIYARKKPKGLGLGFQSFEYLGFGFEYFANLL